MKILLLFVQMIIMVHGMPAAQESDDPAQEYAIHGNPSEMQDKGVFGSDNETQENADQELENNVEPSQFDDYSFLINQDNENVGQHHDIQTQDSINQAQGSENQSQDSVIADDENSVQDSSSISTVNSGFTSGGRFNGDLVNSRTYYSDTVHDCQRRCQRKTLCSQFNFRKEDGEDDGECTLLRRKTKFEQLPDCHNCKTGPKFSRQSRVGPIVVEKIIAQVSPGWHQGTDDTIKFRFKSGDSECVTRALDDFWNNWATGTQETHEISCRIENPGQFIQLEASFEMDKWGLYYDRLCLGDFRVTLDDGTEYSYDQELCGEGPNSQGVTLQRVL